jgi:hypothetical protein
MLMITKRLNFLKVIGKTILILLLFLPVPLLGRIEFSPPQELLITGKLLDINTHDLSGDGLEDIISLSEIEENGRPTWLVSIFFQEEMGKFGSRPIHVAQVDSTITLISPVTLPESGEGILTYISQGGLYSLYRSGEGGDVAGEKLLELDTSVMTASRERPMFFDYAGDWNGDGLDDVLVFDFSGFSFLTFESDNSLILKSHINCPPKLRVYQMGYGDGSSSMRGDNELVMRYGFPILVRGEYNGDGMEDLFITSGDRLRVSTQDSSGGFSEPILIKHFKKPVSDNDGDDMGLRISLADFDGDGLMDVSEGWWKGTGLSGTEAYIRLYLGKGSKVSLILLCTKIWMETAGKSCSFRQ